MNSGLMEYTKDRFIKNKNIKVYSICLFDPITLFNINTKNVYCFLFNFEFIKQLKNTSFRGENKFRLICSLIKNIKKKNENI